MRFEDDERRGDIDSLRHRRGVPEATPEAAAPAHIVSTPTMAPFTKGAMVPLSTGEPMDYDSAFFVDPVTGAWVVVIDRAGRRPPFRRPADAGRRRPRPRRSDERWHDVLHVPKRVDPQTVYVRISRDRATVLVSSATNVHDATPLVRRSGGVDVYYIAAESDGFHVRRRSVDAEGRFGAEQTLSDASAGSLTQPRPHRLGDGSIVMTFAQQVTSNAATDSYLVHLTSDDAP